MASELDKLVVESNSVECLTCGKVSNNYNVGENFDEAFNNCFADQVSKDLGVSHFIKDTAIANFCSQCSEKLIGFKRFKEKCLETLDSHDIYVKKQFPVYTKHCLDRQVKQETLASKLKADNKESNRSKRQLDEENNEQDDEQGWWDSYHEKQILNPTGTEDENYLSLMSKDYNCSECGIIFQSQSLFRQHYFSVHNNVKDHHNAIWCSICKIDIPYSGFTGHIIDNHCTILPNNQIECGICQKKVVGRLRLQQHFYYHREYKDPRKCPVCPDTYIINVRKYLSHMANIHNKGKEGRFSRLFTCQICSFQTSSAPYYECHVRIGHFGDKYCRYCKKPILSKDWDEHYKAEAKKAGYDLNHDLTKVIRDKKGNLVQDKKKLIAQCNLCFRIMAGDVVAKHMESHNETWFKCDLCESEFKSQTNLDRHKLNIHRDNFSCDICGAKTSNKLRMATHMIENHVQDLEATKSACDICGKKYYKDYLPKHMKKVHSESKNKDKSSKTDKQKEEAHEMCTKCGDVVKIHARSSHSCYTVTRTKRQAQNGKQARAFNRYDCEDCDFTTTTIKIYRHHVRTKHATWFCTICPTKACFYSDKGFFNREDMAKHLLNRHKKAFSLDLCKGELIDRPYPSLLLKLGPPVSSMNMTKYPSAPLVRNQMNIYKEDGTIYNKLNPNIQYILGDITCKYCPLEFNRLKVFKLHVELKHLNMIPFKCSKCVNYGFVNEGQLQTHYRKKHDTDYCPAAEPTGLIDSILQHGTLKSVLKIEPEGVRVERINARKRGTKRSRNEVYEDDSDIEAW